MSNSRCGLLERVNREPYGLEEETDHAPLPTILWLRQQPLTSIQSRRSVKILLNKDISDKDLIKTMMIASWPNRPFCRVAAQRGLTRRSIVEISEFDKV